MCYYGVRPEQRDTEQGRQTESIHAQRWRLSNKETDGLNPEEMESLDEQGQIK
jgi:hypothetical protein